MISVLRTKLLSALQEVAQMRLLPPDAGKLVVCLQAVSLPDQFLDISLLYGTFERTVAIPCRGEFMEPWEVAVHWLPLRDYVAAEDRTTVLHLDRTALYLAVRADYTDAIFQAVNISKEREHEEPDKEGNPGSLPQQ